MVKEYAPRPASESSGERQYLARRLAEIDRDMGITAARLGAPTPITQPLDTLDRARELVSDLVKEVHVQSLDDALTSRLAWLDRAEALHAREDGEPKIGLSRVALDRRLLQDLQRGWQTPKQ